MENKSIPSYKDRLIDIIDLSYNLLCNKIAGGEIIVDNEASLQHQLSLILKQIGQHYLFSIYDRLEVVLEKDLKLNKPTNKSPKKSARCDIWLTMKDTLGKNNVVNVAIELKYFKYSKTNEATTDNRFYLLFDLENLEQYKKEEKTNKADLCYAFVYSTNSNYANDNTTSTIKLSPKITKTAERNVQKNKTSGEQYVIHQKVDLNNEYAANWINYNKHHYFLKVDLQEGEKNSCDFY